MTLPAPELFTNNDVTEEQFKYQLRQLILSLYSRIDIDTKFFNRNQINEKFYDKDEVDALITGANIEALEKILHDVIEVALAGGAGAAGWTDALIQTSSGRTQRELNNYIKKQTDSYIASSNLGSDNNILTKFLQTGSNYLLIDESIVLTEPLLITSDFAGKTISFAKGVKLTWGNGLNFNSIDAKALIKFSQNLSDFSLINPVVDGNKQNTTSDIDNACFGILFAANLNFKNVKLINPVSFNNRGTGINYSSGGVIVENPYCYDNLWHGQGSAYLDSDITTVNGSKNINNGAYGFDFSKGNVVHSGTCYCEGNKQGGAKTSTDCKNVEIDTLYLKSNKNIAFRTTGEAPALLLNIKSLKIIDAPDASGVISIATGNKINIGSIYINQCLSTDVAVRLGDCEEINIETITVENSTNRGVYIRNTDANIGSLKVKGTGGTALLVDAASNVHVDKLLLKDTSKTGASTDQNAIVVTAGSVLTANNIKHTGTSSKGATVLAASKLIVKFHDFGTLSAANSITTSGAGSLYRVEDTSGIVSNTFEVFTLSGNGSSTVFTLTLSNPLASIGGGVYTASVYGNSTDANTYPFSVYQVSPTLVRIRYTTAPVSGVDNLIFNVNVKLDKSVR